jgi:hypothetical protein
MGEEIERMDIITKLLILREKAKPFNCQIFGYYRKFETS